MQESHVEGVKPTHLKATVQRMATMQQRAITIPFQFLWSGFEERSSWWRNISRSPLIWLQCHFTRHQILVLFDHFYERWKVKKVSSTVEVFGERAIPPLSLLQVFACTTDRSYRLVNKWSLLSPHKTTSSFFQESFHLELNKLLNFSFLS